LESYNTTNLIQNLKLNHIISDRERYAYVICMYACALFLGCMFGILVSCMQKLF